MSTVVNGVGEILQRCREEGRAALVGYLPVGFPTVEGSLEAMRVLVEAGCSTWPIAITRSRASCSSGASSARPAMERQTRRR